MGQVGNAHGLGLAVAWACVAQVGLFAACCIMGFLSGPVWWIIAAGFSYIGPGRRQRPYPFLPVMGSGRINISGLSCIILDMIFNWKGILVTLLQPIVLLESKIRNKGWPHTLVFVKTCNIKVKCPPPTTTIFSPTTNQLTELHKEGTNIFIHGDISCITNNKRRDY